MLRHWRFRLGSHLRSGHCLEDAVASIVGPAHFHDNTHRIEVLGEQRHLECPHSEQIVRCRRTTVGGMNQLTLPSTSLTPEWEATARYGVRPAPDGLALVQDFLNTRASVATGPDLLRDATHATVWGAHAVRSWSARRGTAPLPPTLTDNDAAMLRHLRDTVDDALPDRSADTTFRLAGTAELTITAGGGISWMPTGLGWRWFYGALLGEVLLSQHTTTWQRLKQCDDHGCRATFYDSSWDISAVCHHP